MALSATQQTSLSSCRHCWKRWSGPSLAGPWRSKVGICALSCWSHGHHQAPGAGREKPASPVSSFPDALSLPLLHDHGQTCFSLFPPQDTRCPLFDFAGVLPELFVFLAPLLFIWNTRSGSRLLRPVFLHLLPGPYLSSSLKFTHNLVDSRHIPTCIKCGHIFPTKLQKH